MKVNLTLCQHMVDKWHGQKRMEFMLWTVSLMRATISLDIWERYTSNMVVSKTAPYLKVIRRNHFKCFQFLESHLPLDVSANLQPFDDEPDKSKKVWLHLCTKYRKIDKETERTLINFLSNIRMQTHEATEEYLERAQELRNSSATRKSYIDDLTSLTMWSRAWRNVLCMLE